ncbi:MAG: oxidoreductase [Candidatus Tectimicrobiota bacterium]|nr:MAG: oxidoreductase [Candidatus Tectomicrobia bacterium]
MDALVRDLQKHIAGEVRFDAFSRMLYSTDASIYQIEPLGVVIPAHADDIVATVQVAAAHGVPVLPRGGGTSLAGQTVGRAVIIDVSPRLNQVLELNPEEQWAWVQPGLVQDQFNAYLRPHGFLFGPDTATSNRATLGGMIGNNSAGARSVIYGKTVDHVLELQVVLADGSTARLQPLDKAQLEQKQRAAGLEGHIYREVVRLVEAHRDEIAERYPRLMRRVSGYNLDELVKDGPFNLAKLVVGSEGTLAVVTAAKVRIMPRPRATAVLVVHFDDMIRAVEAANTILPFHPSAIELVDHQILNAARAAREFAGQLPFLQGEPEAILIVEFYGETAAEAADKVAQLTACLRRERLGYAYAPALSAQEQAAVWKMRKAGLGLLMGTRDERKPIAFVEDTAVAPEKLPEFLRRFRDIIAAYETHAGYYGHASVGCLHIRPCINLKKQEEIDKMYAMMQDISALVAEFGGAMSGEHGDGLARSWLNEKLFGPRLYQAFREVKRAFDPHNRLNPGKIVDAPAPTENLRYGPWYRPLAIDTVLDFRRDGGFATAIEMCNGNGACRKLAEGTMCPSYQATLDEQHSTRGRANALRAILAGHLPPEEFTGKRLYEILDLCLECKACKTECPSNVDMAKLKAEFLCHYYARHGVPLRARLFAGIARWQHWGQKVAPLANWLGGSAVGKWLLQRLGIAPQRTLPRLARQTFSAWFRRHTPLPQAGRRGQVVLFHDTFAEYNCPEVAQAATQLLEAAGFAVQLVPRRCCGRPAISKGLLHQARALAQYNVASLAPYARRGIPIVGLEPSCLLTLRDDYLDLVPGEEATAVAEKAVTLDEFLYQLQQRGELDLTFTQAPRRLLLHGHCHQKALVGTAPTLAVLRLPPGYEVEEIPSGCCGMAGSFGYEAEHYALSLAIGRQRLFPAVQAADASVTLVANGISCRQQIEHATGRRAYHLAEVLWEATQKGDRLLFAHPTKK